jgi:hexosaminidase
MLNIPPARAAGGTPQTVPALREWTAGSGGFTASTTGRILLDPAYSGPLATTGDVFADDLQALTGTRPGVIVTAARSAAQPGDIWLSLGSGDAALGDEGYRLESGPVIAITARTPAGVFYGTRTVLQLLTQSSTIPGGVARDWPTYPERGVHIDSNQRRYSRAWWRNLIRDMAYVKMNQVSVMLYLKGFSDAEKAELTSFAARYNVAVVPVVSMPNHTGGTINAENPGLALQAGGQPAVDSMDFTKPGALEVMRSWIERDIDKFPGRFWHTGGDEYLVFAGDQINWSAYGQFAAFARAQTGNPAATGQDAYTWIMNWINGVVKAHGKTLRVWNDQLQTGGAVRLDPDIVVEHWIAPVTSTVYRPQQLLDNGNTVLNFSLEYLYYNEGVDFIDPQRVYDEFRVTRFAGGEIPYHPGLRGARLATWMYQTASNTPVEDNTEMYARLFGPVRALAQVTWDTPKLSDFNGFQALYDRLGNAPGYLPLTDVVTGAAVTLRDPFGRLTYTARMGDQVRYGTQAVPTGDFSDPATLTGGVAGPVVATADRDGRPVFFARTAAGDLVHGWQATAGGSWTTSVLTGGAVGTPSVVLDQVGRLAYFVRTGSGGLLHGWQSDPGSSASWGSAQLTTGIAGDPVGTVDGNGRLLFFVRTTANELRHGWQVQPGQGPWQDAVLAGGMGGDPGVVVDPNGRVLYFFRTTAAELRHGWQLNIATGPWQSAVLASGIAGRPVPCVDVTGRVLYFVRQNDGGLLHGWQSQPGQGPWGNGVLTGDLAADPVALNDRAGRVLYFVRTNGGDLFHGWQVDPATGPWNGTVLTGGIGGDPTVAVDRSGRVTYVVHAATGVLWRGWQDTPGNGPWHQATLLTN